MKRGRLIVVEGLEGAGKSTAMQTLEVLFQRHHLSYITTREPGGTSLGEMVRTLLKHAHEEPLHPRAELLLFYAARVQLYETVVKPALEQGIWVLADRCELSSFAYQGGGRDLDSHILKELSAFCVGDLQADLLFYLDITPEIGLERAKMRGTLDRIEQEPLSFFQKVHAAYHYYLQQYPSVVCIDAAQDLPQVQEDLKLAMIHYLATQDVSA
ncbi:MAG TPA: dTMP kinase [Legionellaceae bacterium]|nr:dTMP kinase [Legionellaceae bacterium]